MTKPKQTPHVEQATDDQPAKKGYINLTFFNLFWIFMAASFIGLLVEVLYHALLTGEYEDRAGVLWGPFSPIYGFGAVFMTIVLNRFHRRPLWQVFLISAVVGASFEFFVSWFLEVGFGVTAWNYSDTKFNIDGRTNLAFAFAWGFLGMVWIKLFLPELMKHIRRIPQRWRKPLTITVAMFMIGNGLFTLITLDAWHLRATGHTPSTFVQRYCALHFDDEYMKNRFQTMSME